jgi:maltooligosyltrehalose trehalohydrolase
MTSPFIPLLFQGEEWGAGAPFLYFTDHQDAALAKAVCEGRRREFAAFGWKPEEIPDPQARETFERCKLDWTELSRPPHAELLQWHRQLIDLRRREGALNDGRRDDVHVRFDERERWLAIERGLITVACNMADTPKRIALRPGTHRLLMSSAPTPQTAVEALLLAPDSVAILKETRRDMPPLL